MARPYKAGLDYFPLDVNVDDKIELIEAKHGLIGFGIVIKLFQQIYKNGYFIRVTEDRLLLLKKNLGVDVEIIQAVIADAIRWELFSEKIYVKYTVLTSRGIQKRYIEATKRRKDIKFFEEYLLVNDVESKYPDYVNVDISLVNVGINPGNGNGNPQSKVKKSKVKKSSKTYKVESAEVLAYLNEKTGRNYERTDEIVARLNDGRTVDQCKTIIDNQCEDTYFKENQKHLNPVTLFRKSHWDKYLNNIPNPLKKVISSPGQATVNNLTDLELS